MLYPRATGTEGAYVAVNERPLGGHRMLLRELGSADRVLDVGCSTGYLARPLAERGSRVVGIERNPQAAAGAQRWCEQVLTGDIETMELPFPPGSFDAIACGDLIEHLRRPDDFLSRVRPLLARDGRLVLSTPNVANWSVRLALLFGSFRYTERGILDRDHAHLFTRRTLLECLARSGYRVEKVDFTVPVPIIGSPRVERLAHAIGALRPTLLAFQFVVRARPR